MNLNKLLSLFLQNANLLTEDQRKDCLTALNAASKGGDVPDALTKAVPSCCPHCNHQSLCKWGVASGLQRWKCRSCSKTFNILTKTPLARLRKKEKWEANAKAMIDGKSVRDTASDCQVHPNTAFRWRHRFLDFQQKAQHTDLKGIAESDATYFYYSEKGKKKLDRKPRKRGGDGIIPGISKDLVTVISLRDRIGFGADRISVAQDRVRIHAHDLYDVHLSSDTLLITDGDLKLCAAARDRNPKAHLELPGKETRGCGYSPYHLQTSNSFHSSLKSWMRRFNGVATKYLANYIGWHRHLFEKNHQKSPQAYIALAFNPLSICPQLTMT